MKDFDRLRSTKIARYFGQVKDGKNKVPISIQVALLDACFNRCIGCGHPLREQKRMDLKKWIGFLESLPALPESICYSGGDPMAYTEFNDIMRWHIKNGVLFGCTISGYIPHHIDLDLLAESHWVRVSLDAIDEEIYKTVRGKTPVKKIFEGIEKMIAAGVNVEIFATLSEINEGELPKIKEYAKDVGISIVNWKWPYPDSNPNFINKTKKELGVVEFETCSAALYQSYIDSNGDLYSCCVTVADTRDAPKAPPLGNIFNDSWDEIFSEIVRFSKIKYENLPDICRTCCVKRLSEINQVCDELKTLPLQSFF